MEKANKIKAYEEVSKAFTDILRNSLDDDFRSQFYSLLNVTNTNDAHDVLNRNLKQFLERPVVGASNKKKLKRSTKKAIQEYPINIPIKELKENKEETIQAEESNIVEDEFGFNSHHTTFCSVLEELEENKEQTIQAEESNIEEDEFGFNSSHTTFCSVLEVLNEDKERNIIAKETNIGENKFGFNSNDTTFCSVPERLNENNQQITIDEEIEIDADEFGFNVSDSLQAASVSVLNMEADEFEFYSESNKFITFSTSQTNCTEKDQKQFGTPITIEDDDFGFFSNSEKSIWSTSNEDQKEEEDNMKLFNSEETELEDLEIWL